MPLYIPQSKSALRYEAMLAAQGLSGESAPKVVESSTSPMATQVVYFSAIGLAAGDLVTNIVTVLGTVGTPVFSGSGLTCGLYDKTGVRLGLSADTSALYTTVGPKVNPLGTPYPVPTTDLYYAAVLAIFASGTALQLLRGLTTATYSTPLAGSSYGSYGTQGAQATLPSPATIGFASASGIAYYLGWS